MKERTFRHSDFVIDSDFGLRYPGFSRGKYPSHVGRVAGLLALIASVCAGCAPYTQVQMDLADQARKGITIARQADADRAQVVAQLQQLQRHDVDAAFDEDVRNEPTPDPDWIIEHRKAYAAALDALYRQQSASTQATAAAAANLDAIDAALQRLMYLQDLQLKIFRW